MTGADCDVAAGLSLAPFRAVRYAGRRRLGQLLCPPYDVIDDAARANCLRSSPITRWR